MSWVLRHALAGMTAALWSEAQAAVDLLRIEIPEVPAEIPVIHFRDALLVADAPPDEPDLARAHERAIGRWAARTHGSEFVAVEGYPMSERPFYTHPATRRRPLAQQLRPALPRPGPGDRRPAPAPALGLPGGHPRARR